jgi:hypothetical protein
MFQITHNRPNASTGGKYDDDDEEAVFFLSISVLEIFCFNSKVASYILLETVTSDHL